MVDDNHPIFLNYKFSLPHVIDFKVVIALNHSISRIFKNSKGIKIQI
jgi:hypothetical protein